MGQPMRAGDADDFEPSRGDLDVVLASMTLDNPEFRTRVEASRASHEADMRRTGCIPTLADYRKVYDNLHAKHGYRLVSDEEILRTHLVAR